jgi:hypothetical protein
MNKVVKHNLKLMMSEDQGGMIDALSNESWGGNAGFVNRKISGVANFFFKVSTGHILLFSNMVKDKKDVLKGMFRVVSTHAKMPRTRLGRWLKLKFNRRYPQIIETILPQGVPKQSRLNIEISVKMYNQTRK